MRKPTVALATALLLFFTLNCNSPKKAQTTFVKPEPNTELIKSYQDTVVKLGKTYEQITTLQKKVDTLSLAMNSSGIKGCKASEPITRLEVTLDGEHEDDNNISAQVPPEEAKSLLKAYKEPPKTMIFKFSLGVAHDGKAINFENDEAAQVLFVAGGTKSVKVAADSGFVIGDIDYIKIVKAAPNYQVTDTCAGMAASACKDKYIILEKDRYHLMGLTIKINSKKIYLNEKLDFTFAKYSSSKAGEIKGMEWIEGGIKLNQEFMKLMQEPCTP